MSFHAGKAVSQITRRCGQIAGCMVCGIGIAIDVVGIKMGEPPYDWMGSRFGHECALTKNGPSEEQKRLIAEIQAEIGPTVANPAA